MKPLLRSLPLLAALLAGCSGEGGTPGETPVTPLAADHPAGGNAAPASADTGTDTGTDTHVDPHAWETHCIGRFLVELPPGSQIDIMNPGFMSAPVGSLPMSRAEFQMEKQEEREIFVNGPRAIARTTNDSRFDDQVVHPVFDESGWLGCSTAGSIRNEYSCHGAVWGQNTRADAFTICEGRERQECEARIRQVLTRYRPRPGQALPERPGFCVNGGLYEDAAKPAFDEKFNAHIRFRDHPDLTMVISAYDYPIPVADWRQQDWAEVQQSRLNTGDVGPGYQAISIGPRQHGLRIGSELVTRVQTPEGHLQHMIEWWRAPTETDPTTTELDVYIRNAENTRFRNTSDWRRGRYMAPTLDLPQMQALYSRIIAGLRLQPAYAQGHNGPGTESRPPPTP